MLFEVILSFICGMVAIFAFFKLSEAKAISIVRKKAQMKGQEAQQEQSVRLMAFLTELKIAYDEANSSGPIDLKDFGIKKALPIALKYPDVIAKNGKSLLKLMGNNKDGKDSGLGELLGGLL